jgi:NIPSNAP
MLFELRQYRVYPGQRDRWVKFMEEVIIPFQVSKGMVVVGSFVADEDPDAYVWIRRFENEQEREQLYKAVYESDHWKNEIAPRVSEMLDRPQMVITRLQPTPRSVIH